MQQTYGLTRASALLQCSSQEQAAQKAESLSAIECAPPKSMVQKLTDEVMFQRGGCLNKEAVRGQPTAVRG